MLAIIAGTGIADRLLDEIDARPVDQIEVETPFGRPSTPVRKFEFGAGRALFVLDRHGPGHAMPPHRVPYRANIFALKKLGVTHLIASGAVGSLQEAIGPGDVVMCDQFIDRTTLRPRTFFDALAVHAEFADPVCATLRQRLAACAETVSVQVHTAGTYVCIEGPTFSTRAESHMHQQWGAHVVGMTALPEARLAREASIAYALIALPTDYDCWKPHPDGASPESLLEQIRENLEQASEAACTIIRAALASDPPIEAQASEAHRALELGVWSDLSQISEDDLERLGPLLPRS